LEESQTPVKELGEVGGVWCTPVRTEKRPCAVPCTPPPTSATHLYTRQTSPWQALLLSHCLIDALMLVRHLLCGNERYLRGTETLRPLWHLLLLPHTPPCNSSLACTHASLVAHVWARQADGPHLTILARHLQSTPCNILFRRMTPHPHFHY